MNCLVYYCRVCEAKEKVGEGEADSRVEHRLVNAGAARSWRSAVKGDMVHDPTLHRNMGDCECPQCGHKNAVFFQAQSTRREESMKLVFVCLNCRHAYLS